MSRKNIIILIVITLFIGLIAYTFLQEKTEIKKVIFTENKSISYDEVEKIDNTTDFEFSTNSQIYAVIIVSNMKKSDKLKIDWYCNSSLYQQNSFEAKEEGLAKIIVSLIKKENQNQKGNYQVKVSLNNTKPQVFSFIVK